MNVAVVGGNGFIGRELVTYLETEGHTVFVIGSDCNVFDEDGNRIAKETLEKSDSMVFLAARRPTSDFSIDDYLYNIRLAEKYLCLANEVFLEDVVLTSSRSVYSKNDTPWKEDDFQTPLSLYGASKQAMDSLALWYNQKYGMKIKSLRLAQVIGTGEKKGYLLNTLLDNAIAGRQQTIYGKGVGRRQYVYVKDVCDAILHSITSERDNGGIFNIGLNYNVSVVEIATIINDVFGNKSGIELLEDKPEDTKEYLMDVSKAERELHWKPKYDLIKAFEDIRDSIV